MTGETLAHFRILEKIAEGGMGVVYRALDTNLGRTVAIKVIHPQALGDPERKQRFVQEARTASALNHPNIVTIHEIASEGDVDFIAMEYVEGQSLDLLARARPLDIDQVIDFGIQIASALGAAHASGIVHRDIKPANVIVTPAGHVKVLDFGLAKLAERLPVDSETATAHVAARTQEGVIVGTVAYMSPEQAEAKSVDARSDVFSLGAVLYELLAGRRPFQGDSTLSTLAAIMRDGPVPLRNVRPEVPEDLARIVARCLEKDRAARYRTGEDVAAELKRCREQRAGHAAALPGGLFRSPVAWALGLAIIAATGTTVWWVLGRGGVGSADRTAASEMATLDRPGAFLRCASSGPQVRSPSHRRSADTPAPPQHLAPSDHPDEPGRRGRVHQGLSGDRSGVGAARKITNPEYRGSARSVAGEDHEGWV